MWFNVNDNNKKDKHFNRCPSSTYFFFSEKVDDRISQRMRTTTYLAYNYKGQIIVEPKSLYFIMHDKNNMTIVFVYYCMLVGKEEL